MNIDNSSLRTYNSSLIKRLFAILDLTNNAISDKDFENIEKYISGLETEIRGSLTYYSDCDYGNQVPSVLMKISGIKSVTDYNVRRKAVLDSIGILDKVSKSIKE
jgi:hypothetical protein